MYLRRDLGVGCGFTSGPRCALQRYGRLVEDPGYLSLALRPLVLAIESFAAFNISLQTRGCPRCRRRRTTHGGDSAASRAARRWLDERRLDASRVSSVWRILLEPKGHSRNFLPVSENHRGNWIGSIRSWHPGRTGTTVYDRFDEINAAGSPANPQRVTGAGKQDLHREVEEATELVERWCNLVKARARYQSERRLVLRPGYNAPGCRRAGSAGHRSGGR